jgi:hypothetical protein
MQAIRALLSLTAARDGHHLGRGTSAYSTFAGGALPCVHDADADAVYRPRHPELTTLHRLLAEHFESYLLCHPDRFEPIDGPLRPHVQRAVEQYLECGRLQSGFARIRCECGEERLLAFSCQTRSLCPSCQAKRAALFGIHLAETILAPYPHTHVVFTVPKVLRGLFQRDRRLLGILSRSAFRALREVMHDQFERTDVVPGFVASLQTFGSFLNWQPHVHSLVSEGAFTAEGEFLTLWQLDTDAVEARFREYVIRGLQDADRLSDEFAENLRSWEHSGFDVFAGRQMTVTANRTIEEMGRYMTRPPVTQDRPEVLADGRVLMPTPPHPVTGATEIILDPLELVHRIVMQIPDKGSHMVRYYGAYSCRGRRAGAERDPVDEEAGDSEGRAGGEGQGQAEEGEQVDQAADTDTDTPYTRKRRLLWAQLIRRIFEVDPLECPECGGEMRVISVITDPSIVDRILRHIERTRGQDPPVS